MQNKENYMYNDLRVNGVKVTPDLASKLHDRHTFGDRAVSPNYESEWDALRVGPRPGTSPKHRMTKQEYRDFVAKTFEEMRALIDRKNSDYCGTGDDPFANFRRATAVGVDPYIGLCVRFLDKVGRIESFAQAGSLKNESLEDAWLDVIGYACLALGVLSESKRAETASPVLEPLPSSRL